jgi:hypothetical protein
VHDVWTFGLGFLRSISSKEEYIFFTTGNYHFYNTMENCLDEKAASMNHKSCVAGRTWAQFPELRRAEKLKMDLEVCLGPEAVKKHLEKAPR